VQIHACGGIKSVFVELELELRAKLTVLELELAESQLVTLFFCFFITPLVPAGKTTRD
jgi:hypothetical protein